MANQRNGTIYVGVTSDLIRRAAEHKSGALPGFTERHGCKQLVWFELHADISAAIALEKQIRSGPRARKLVLIETSNPQWRDLYDEIL
jgi:predicted GIY-YIG superfamily endonuclease